MQKLNSNNNNNNNIYNNDNFIVTEVLEPPLKSTPKYSLSNYNKKTPAKYSTAGKNSSISSCSNGSE